MSLSIISDAVAATTQAGAAAQPAGNNMGSLLMLIAFVVIFYFMMLRPQLKRAKDHKNLIKNLAPGDEVVTNGGLIGKMTKIGDDFITLAVYDNVEIKVQKGAVTAILPKGTLKSV